MTHVLKPFVTAIPDVDEGKVAEALDRFYDLEGVLLPLPGERDQNFRLDTGTERFVIKIANPGEERAVLDMQQAALEHLDRVGCEVPTPRVVRTIDGDRVTPIEVGRTTMTMWVQSYLAGEVVRARPMWREVGVLAAELQHGLAGFFHPAAGRELLWDARSLPLLRSLTALVPEEGVRGLIAAVIDRVEDEVLPLLPSLPSQVLHNDLNPANILAGAGGQITGVVDFGDMLHAPRVADLAIAASYQLSSQDDPAQPLMQMVTGFMARSELTKAELEVLVDLVAARLCQTVVIANWRARLHQKDVGYILSDVDDAVRTLGILEGADGRLLSDQLKRTAGFGARSSRDLARRRQESLGPGLRLMYGRPLHLARGEGVWLFDEKGERYLDAYNNVLQLGHAHPAVVGAVHRQARRLNTNTRYLTQPPIEFAERLAALLPNGLDVCYFTNSGSEANDLALRIAMAITGHRGVIVTDHAYHGTTGLTAAISPEERTEPLAEWVGTVASPNGQDSAESIERTIDRLGAAGHRPAALIYDTIFSSDGIFDPGGVYLDQSMVSIRAAGGLFIADEVQAGLGRVGERLWGFATAGELPDIVTLGKPIGNGHPIGAVVTSRDIAVAFGEREHFFSTFGGSTVSAAAGLAVIEATMALGLPERAEAVGAHLRRGLEELAGGSPQLVEVRGAGLFLGVETTEASIAGELVEGLKERRVLIGRTGPDGNVLKIRPPLVFEEEHADMVVAALAEAL